MLLGPVAADTEHVVPVAARLCALLGCGAALACGSDDGLDYSGNPGQPTLASFDQWVPAVDVSVAGQVEHVLLDSGAPLSLFDTDSFELDDGLHSLDVSLGALTFHDLAVVAFDVITYAQSRRPPLSGIIGGDVLTEFAFSLDYAGSRIWLEDSPLPLPEGIDPDVVATSESAAATVAGGGVFSSPDGDRVSVGPTRFLVWARAEDHGPEDGFWALVDTGASSVVISSALADDLAEHQSRPRLDGVTVGTAAGVVTAYLTRMWSLRLGGAAGEAEPGIEQTSVAALVLPDDSLFASASAETGRPIHAIVGGSYLRYFVTTLDYPAEELILHRYRDSSHVPDDEYVALGFELEQDGDDWRIARVFPDTDAEGEGLEVGEIVLELDNVAVTGLPASAIGDILAPFELGDEVPVGVSRQQTIVTVNVAIEDLLPPFEMP